jgi:hypothetical protein
MEPKIVSGSVFISDGAARPPSCEVEKLTSVPGWGCVTNYSPAELGREVESDGWTFFYMAGEIRSTSFGRDETARTERSLRRLLGAAALGPCNCLQITDVKRRSFAGIPYVSLIAHARHLQKSRFFEAKPHSTFPGMPAVE